MPQMDTTLYTEHTLHTPSLTPLFLHQGLKIAIFFKLLIARERSAMERQTK